MMNTNEAKDFKIVQVWPNQLVRTRKYEAALHDRNEAINRLAYAIGYIHTKNEALHSAGLRAIYKC